MEEQAMKLMAQVALVGVAVYVVASMLGKGQQARIKPHSSMQKQDPTSNVWFNTSVQGPNAVGSRGQNVTGYVGVA
jgi:hypothetical protein